MKQTKKTNQQKKIDKKLKEFNSKIDYSRKRLSNKPNPLKGKRKRGNAISIPTLLRREDYEKLKSKEKKEREEDERIMQERIKESFDKLKTIAIRANEGWNDKEVERLRGES